jgi:hypothetical protein
MKAFDVPANVRAEFYRTVDGQRVGFIADAAILVRIYAETPTQARDEVRSRGAVAFGWPCSPAWKPEPDFPISQAVITTHHVGWAEEVQP